MTETIPPLPDLEISKSTAKLFDQAAVDRALQIIYERRPDLLEKIGEQEKKDLGIKPVAEDLLCFLREEVRKEVSIPDLNAMTSIAREVRRRVRVMYGLPI